IKEINALIRNAHINIIPTFQPTGIKLKLLAALFSGRFCIANSAMVENTGLEKLCIIANTTGEMKKALKKTFPLEFKAEDIIIRTEVLNEKYSNKINIQNFLRQVLQYP
ncbi:MAG: mannosyltransferase, partial [Bacteroidia bacterium]